MQETLIDEEQIQPSQPLLESNEFETPDDQQPITTLIPSTVECLSDSTVENGNIVINEFNDAAGPPPSSHYTPMYTVSYLCMYQDLLCF